MRTSLLLAALAATGLAPLASAQTLPCRTSGTCDQDLQLVVTQNDGVNGGTLTLAIQVRTDGVAPTNTLGSATIDIEVPNIAGTELTPSNIINGELCALPAYTCAVNIGPTGDVIRLGITSANVGGGFGQNAGYNVPETYVTFVTYVFTILDSSAIVDFIVRTNTLTVGYFDDPNNADGDGQIDGVVPFGVISNATNTPLPVELTAFEAAAEDEAVVLAWSTASETQNAGFALERATVPAGATAALAWELVGFVEGAGTTATAQTYRFRDGALPYAAGAVRYRLTQVDLDGQRTMAGEAEVAVGAPAAFRLLAPFPNPAQRAATVRYELPRAERVAVVAYNALGQEVARLADGEQEAGRYEVALDAGRLAPGIYVVRFVAGGASATRKLTVVR